MFTASVPPRRVSKFFSRKNKGAPKGTRILHPLIRNTADFEIRMSGTNPFFPSTGSECCVNLMSKDFPGFTA